MKQACISLRKDESKANLKIRYTSSERNQAKALLEASGAVRTQLSSERYAHWANADGSVWVEYDDPPFYTLFLEGSQDAGINEPCESWFSCNQHPPASQNRLGAAKRALKD